MNAPTLTDIDADVMKKAREYAASVVDDMCLTWRHDYGLMEKTQAIGLRKSMEQIAYHDVSKAIAHALQAARNEERERCAKIADKAEITIPLAVGLADGAIIAARQIATAIRNGGE